MAGEDTECPETRVIGNHKPTWVLGTDLKNSNLLEEQQVILAAELSL